MAYSSISHSRSISVDVVSVPDRIAAFGMYVLSTYLKRAPMFVLVSAVKLLALVALSQASLLTIYLPYSSPDLVTPVSLVLVVVALAVYAWSFLALIILVKNRHENIGFVETVRESFKLVPSFWLLVVLVISSIMSGILMFIVPAFIFAVWFLPAFYVLVYEHQRGWRALETSFNYATAHFWKASLVLIVFVSFIYSMHSGISSLVSNSVVILNQGWLEVWQMNQWVIAPITSLVTWAIIVPLAVTFGALAYEWITGRIHIEPLHVFRPMFQKVYRSLPSLKHRPLHS